MTIGDRIKKAREKKGWTQKELAQQLGYESHMTIWRWENDDYPPPNRALMALERVLGPITGSKEA